MTAANDQLRAARERTASPTYPDECLSRQELAELVNAYVWEHHHKMVELEGGWSTSCHRTTAKIAMLKIATGARGPRPRPASDQPVGHGETVRRRLYRAGTAARIEHRLFLNRRSGGRSLCSLEARGFLAGVGKTILIFIVILVAIGALVGFSLAKRFGRRK